jgi:hypothetical protein
MNRFARSNLSLLLIGFLGIGSVGVGVCVCADGDVEPGMGCCGGCQGAEDAADRQQNPGAGTFAAAREDNCAGCMYVSLSSGAMLHASSHKSRISLTSTVSFLLAYQADCLDHGAGGGGRTGASRAQRASLRASASLLAQRTVILRI